MPIREVQTTHRQHAVPQNIMDVEFKLIGDLTMRQFTYLLVFGIIAYILYISMVGVFKWPLTAFFVLFGLALAFVPIQERGMDEWFVNFFKAVYSPAQRVWKKEPILPPAFTYQNLALVKQELITLAPTSSRRKLEEYLEIQQKAQVEDRLDIPEKEFILKVRQAFAPVETSVTVEETEYGADEYEKFEAYQPFQPVPSRGQAQPAPTSRPAPSPAPSPVPSPAPTAQTPAEIIKSEGPTGVVPTLGRQEGPMAPREQSFVSAPAAVTSTVSGQPQVVTQKPAAEVPRPPRRPKPIIKTTIPDTFTYTPMTPDRHIGRKFYSMLPSEGQLILPVRGEKVLATSEELDIQKDIDDKTEQLKQLLGQIKIDKDLGQVIQKKEPTPPTPTAPPAPEIIEKPDTSEVQDVVKKVQEENERLSNEILKLKSDIEQSQESEAEKDRKRRLVAELEEEKNKATTDYTSLQRQVLELQERLREKERPKDVGPKKPIFSKMQPITNEPNIVSGVIKTPDGEALPGVVLLIKNHKGEAVRALKTNTIGQFSISTPLVKGMYTLEVGSSVEGTAFDIITVDIRGEVIPPIEIIGRLV